MDLLIDGLGQFGWNDLIEVTIITYLFYRLLLLLRRTQAMRMVWGLVVLGMFWLFSDLVGFQTLDWLLSNVYAYIVIAIIVLFQNEIRRLLTQLGRTAYFRSMRRGVIDPVDEIVTAAVGMGANHHGAIIVFEREMSLSQYAEGGIALDATASYDLCVSIFNPGAPLHDGAVIMRQGRVAAAACFLPLTRNPQLSRELGSRHRAAIGISEETDCVALVVSEETGKISIVFDGQLSRGLDPVALAERLRELLSLDDLAVEKEEIKIAEKIPQAHPAEGMGK
jgi:diadenylate cyclase